MIDVMRQSILDFPKQFLWRPKIENKNRLKLKQQIVIAGMGGSALPGSLLGMLGVKRNIIIHRNYGLPQGISSKNTTLIAVSYSGNTEETIDAFQTARKNKMPVAVIATDGKLLRLAKLSGVPYIQIPNTGIQPRTATGFMLLAILALLHENKIASNLRKLSTQLNASIGRPAKRIAQQLKNKIPVVYASERNAAIAQCWKIKFNETSKIPAFWNVLPELNHNEMTGYDWNAKTKNLSQTLAFIFLQDKNDSPRLAKRMVVLKKILESKKLEMLTIPFKSTSYASIFETLLLGDWVAYYAAKSTGADSNNVPLVEKFKKLI